jgi:single-strand DNA-binding protein
MASFNQVIIMGNLTRDPELKYTDSGMPYCYFSVAVNNQFRMKDGTTREDVYYGNVTVWGKNAENCSAYLKKGSGVQVIGRLKNRTKGEGEDKKTFTGIEAEKVIFLPVAGGNSGGAKKVAKDDEPAPSEPDFADDSSVGDDDIPF